MEEYEIRGLYTRRGNTHLEINDPKVRGDAGALQGGKIREFEAYVEFVISNSGNIIEEFYKLEIRIPKKVSIVSNSHGVQNFYKKFVTYEEPSYAVFSIPGESPLFQNEINTIASVNLKITASNIQDAEKLPILIKLFYSNGLKEKTLFLLDLLNYQERRLSISDFI